MDSAAFVRHWLNLSTTVCRLFAAKRLSVVTFWEHFFRLLPRRPNAALAALYWQSTRRRVRARNRLKFASADFDFAYAMWIRKNEKLDDKLPSFQAQSNCWEKPPSFTVLLLAGESHTPNERELSVSSLNRQIYPHWSQIEVDNQSLGPAVANLESDFLVLLPIGSTLAPAALYKFAEAALAEADKELFFGDHDELDNRGRRRRPWFKPRWNEEMFLAQDYLSPAVAIATHLAKDLDPSEVRDPDSLLVAATFGARGAIAHIPSIICHTPSQSKTMTNTQRLAAVARRLSDSRATCLPGPFGTIKVEWPLPDSRPLVTVIIPTKDKVQLLRACVSSILEKTLYENYEILIVDNGSVEKQTASYFNEISNDDRIRIIDFDDDYNFSAINNFAARQALGSFICLLNNDTEVISPGWLSELMRYGVRSNVGAVGAKLLYKDGTIQHAGIVIGIGEAAGHAHRLLPASDFGYFGMAHVAQYVSAVTAACMLVDKRKYLAVGGLDEEKLRVAFNDVDFCLKLERAGWQNVYVPHAILLHYESKSRGLDSAPANVNRFRRELTVLQNRWGTRTYQDPLLNPNLDRASERFVIDI